MAFVSHALKDRLLACIPHILSILPLRCTPRKPPSSHLCKLASASYLRRLTHSIASIVLPMTVFSPQPVYHHPHTSESIRASLRLPHLLSRLSPPSEMVQANVGGYLQMRSDQNQLWASGSVARGVAHAKAGRTAEAIASYEYALELDRTNADAYVARGAAYANTERYQQALSDFER